MNRAVYLILFAAIFLVALLFSVQNLDPVKIYFYRGAAKQLSVEMPLALVLTLELFVGVIIGYLVRMIGYFRLKAENSRLKRQLRTNMTESSTE